MLGSIATDEAPLELRLTHNLRANSSYAFCIFRRKPKSYDEAE